MGVPTEEDLTASTEERTRRFGQSDHVRWYGDDFDDRLSAAGLASARVTPPALLGDAAVQWFRLMPHEIVWVAETGRAVAEPMLADGTGSGLTAAFDALLGELSKVQERLGRARARATGSPRATRCGPGSTSRPARGPGMFTRLGRIARL